MICFTDALKQFLLIIFKMLQLTIKFALLSLVTIYQKNNIFQGIGSNFNKNLVDEITNVRGANYFSLYS